MTTRELSEVSGLSICKIDRRLHECPNATDAELVLSNDEFREVAKTKGNKKTFVTSDGYVVTEDDVIAETGATRKAVLHVMTRTINKGESLTRAQLIGIFLQQKRDEFPAEPDYIRNDYTVKELEVWFSQFGTSPDWKRVLLDMCRANKLSQIEPIITYLESRRVR